VGSEGGEKGEEGKRGEDGETKETRLLPPPPYTHAFSNAPVVEVLSFILSKRIV
jgi:hypothetical protein